MTRAQVAAKVRAEKALHPERFCAHPLCLWRIQTGRGDNPCRKHPAKPAIQAPSGSPETNRR